MSATRALTSALSYLLHRPELGSLHPCLGILGCLWFPVPPPSLEQHVRGLGEVPGFPPWDICFSPSAWRHTATSLSPLASTVVSSPGCQEEPRVRKRM